MVRSALARRSREARAASSGDGAMPLSLTLEADDFWPAQVEGDRGRVDLLQKLPWLRRVIDEGWWPDVSLAELLGPSRPEGARGLQSRDTGPKEAPHMLPRTVGVGS